jgi:hypothetical protein
MDKTRFDEALKKIRKHIPSYGPSALDGINTMRQIADFSDLLAAIAIEQGESAEATQEASNRLEKYTKQLLILTWVLVGVGAATVIAALLPLFRCT